LVGASGGGVRVQRSARSGVRIDARVYVSQNTTDVLLDATPTVTPPSSGSIGTVATITIPSVQFATVPPGGNISTLSASAISGFRTFSSSGTAMHVSISAG